MLHIRKIEFIVDINFKCYIMNEVLSLTLL